MNIRIVIENFCFAVYFQYQFRFQFLISEFLMVVFIFIINIADNFITSVINKSGRLIK